MSLTKCFCIQNSIIHDDISSQNRWDAQHTELSLNNRDLDKLRVSWDDNSHEVPYNIRKQRLCVH